MRRGGGMHEQEVAPPLCEVTLAFWHIYFVNHQQWTLFGAVLTESRRFDSTKVAEPQPRL